MPARAACYWSLSFCWTARSVARFCSSTTFWTFFAFSTGVTTTSRNTVSSTGGGLRGSSAEPQAASQSNATDAGPTRRTLVSIAAPSLLLATAYSLQPMSSLWQAAQKTVEELTQLVDVRAQAMVGVDEMERRAILACVAHAVFRRHDGVVPAVHDRHRAAGGRLRRVLLVTGHKERGR